jgi:hemerythrin
MEPWNPGLDVGHAEMDEAHRGLYQFTVQAADATGRDEVESVRRLLAELFTASEHHFQAEEGLMLECTYPATKEHREAHRAFMTDFGKLRAELEARGLSPLFRLWFGSRFADWLRFHIRGQDVHFYRFHRHWQEQQAQAAEARLIAEAGATLTPAAPPGGAARPGAAGPKPSAG